MTEPTDVGQPKQPIWNQHPGYGYFFPPESKMAFPLQDRTLDTTELTGIRQDEQQKELMEIRDWKGDEYPKPKMWTNAGEYRDLDDRTYSTEFPTP